MNIRTLIALAAVMLVTGCDVQQPEEKRRADEITNKLRMKELEIEVGVVEGAAQAAKQAAIDGQILPDSHNKKAHQFDPDAFIKQAEQIAASFDPDKFINGVPQTQYEPLDVQSAKRWLARNPDHPKAAQVRQILTDLGEMPAPAPAATR